MNKRKRSRFILRASALASLLALSTGGLAACEEKKPAGPLERAGEKVDEKVNDAERAIEDAAD